jgi:hypothetical protein
MKYLRFYALALLLGGCASSYGTIPQEVLGDLSTNGVVFASDEVQEAAIRADAHKEHIEKYGEAYKASGLEVEFEVVEVNGAPAYMPTKLSFREKPQFGEAPSLDKAPHPGWRVAEKLGMGVMKYGVIGYGVHEAAGLVDAIAGGSGGGTSINASGESKVELNSNTSSVEAGGDGVSSVTGSEVNEVSEELEELEYGEEGEMI